MKKTIISTAIAAFVAFSGTSAIASEGMDWEAELNAQSQGLEDLSFDDILGDEGLEDLGIAKESVITAEVEKVKLEEPKKASNEKENVIDKVFVKEVKEEKKVVDTGFDFLDEEPAMETDPSELVFLRYVPEGTRFTIKETFKILPKKKYIIMHNGKRVLKNPQTELEPEKTFCYIKLKPSGKARILKANTAFTVTGTKPIVNDTEVRKSYGTYTLRANQVLFNIDNPNVVNMSCFSATMFEKGTDKEPMPLLIKDLKEQMGDIIKIDYPAYEEI